MKIKIKYIQKCISSQKPITGSEIYAWLKKKDLLVRERNSFSFNSDHLVLKDLLLSYWWWGKPRIRLAARWLTLASVDLQTLLSFIFDTKRTFFPSPARILHKSLSPLASAYIKNTNWIYHLITKNADFGLINHRKRLVPVNAFFGRRDCVLSVQDDISSLQNGCWTPK